MLNNTIVTTAALLILPLNSRPTSLINEATEVEGEMKGKDTYSAVNSYNEAIDNLIISCGLGYYNSICILYVATTVNRLVF